MKILCFNVNGIKQCLDKGLLSFLEKHDFDIICLQEVKSQGVEVDLPNHFRYWCFGEKKGHHGVSIFSKLKPLSVKRFEDDFEGRLLIAEYEDWYLINIYAPNSQDGLARLDFRMEWEKKVRNYVRSLKKDVIICGDLNVIPEKIDIWHKEIDNRIPGCSDEERSAFKELKKIGFVDMFRHFHPEDIQYSYYSYKCTDITKGWRLDHVLSNNQERVKSVEILSKKSGLSDHRPVIFTV